MTDSVTVATTLADAEGEDVSVKPSVGDTLADGDADTDTDSETVADADSLAVTLVDTDALAATVGETETVAAAVTDGVHVVEKDGGALGPTRVKAAFATKLMLASVLALTA